MYVEKVLEVTQDLLRAIWHNERGMIEGCIESLYEAANSQPDACSSALYLIGEQIKILQQQPEEGHEDNG